jgi:hypothetical protein
MAVDKQKMYDMISNLQKSGIGDWWKYLTTCANYGISSYLLVHQKYQKEEKLEVYKTPIEKATSLLNTLEQKKNFGKRRS